ncbi:hypothetical protein MN0502_05820 [Arthrobacter sp. MN05-02]|nr:hypothetical protein MN0502_05820 [Arthrobacter sp. MN05-02]
MAVERLPGVQARGLPPRVVGVEGQEPDGGRQFQQPCRLAVLDAQHLADAPQLPHAHPARAKGRDRRRGHGPEEGGDQPEGLRDGAERRVVAEARAGAAVGPGGWGEFEGGEDGMAAEGHADTAWQLDMECVQGCEQAPVEQPAHCRRGAAVAPCRRRADRDVAQPREQGGGTVGSVGQDPRPERRIRRHLLQRLRRGRGGHRLGVRVGVQELHRTDQGRSVARDGSGEDADGPAEACGIGSERIGQRAERQEALRRGARDEGLLEEVGDDGVEVVRHAVREGGGEALASNRGAGVLAEHHDRLEDLEPGARDIVQGTLQAHAGGGPRRERGEIRHRGKDEVGPDGKQAAQFVIAPKGQLVGQCSDRGHPLKITRPLRHRALALRTTGGGHRGREPRAGGSGSPAYDDRPGDERDH